MSAENATKEMDGIDERIGMLREVLAFFGVSLGWDHVAADPVRRDGILFSMQWAADEIGRINTREARLTAWIHPDILQREVFVALGRKAFEDAAVASRAAYAESVIGEAAQ